MIFKAAGGHEKKVRSGCHCFVHMFVIVILDMYRKSGLFPANFFSCSNLNPHVAACVLRPGNFLNDRRINSDFKILSGCWDDRQSAD